ncbi:MAG: hypothetical protein ABI704_22380 [Kofleriaceae bacterium]
MPTATPASTTVAAAERTKDEIDSEQRAVGLEHVYSMSVAKLVDAVGTDLNVASVVIRARPEDVGEMLQFSTNSRKATAILLVMAVRFELGRSTENAAPIMSSIMRLDGPGAAEVKSSVKAASDDAGAGIGTQIGRSEHDPKWGRFEANFFDRPHDVVLQILSAVDNPGELKEYASRVGQAIENYPRQGHALVAELGNWTDAPSTRVKLAIYRALDRSVADDELAVQNGEIGFNEPYIHAAPLVPALADLMSQPDVALALMNQRARVAGGRQPGLDLDQSLHRVMFKGWGDRNRKEVIEKIGRGAAVLFRRSLEHPDATVRQGEAVRTAEFIATAANIEAEETGESIVKLIASTLKVIGEFLPEGVSTAAKGTVLLLELAEVEHEPAWTREAVNELMRRVYETIHPRPITAVETDTTTDYEDTYAAWAAAPLNTYTSILSKK